MQLNERKKCKETFVKQGSTKKGQYIKKKQKLKVHGKRAIHKEKREIKT